MWRRSTCACDGGAKRLLVVDNDEDMRDVVRTALSHAWFDTLGAASAKQALSFLDHVVPRL
jgi:DNA-binding NtrC family response regulator